jgi:phosphoribosyl-ATP pyrophosphohydrolase/phosphoribosyl-AMP cyclohydrolase
MVIASIDLMNSRAVQLRRGREKILERADVLALAEQFNKYGEIAVIDLDAAMNKGDNIEIVKRILKRAECRVGGGIRNLKRAQELISHGATKVIIGSKAFENDKINEDFLNELVNVIGRLRIIIAVDALNREIVTNAWTHKTHLALFDTISKLDKYCAEFLFTCVEREGTLEGTDLDALRTLKTLTDNKIVMAGGVHSIEEIKECAQLGFDVQLGMALYTGKIDLADAFIESLNWQTELVPTITQDIAGQVLMLAYSNKDSIKKTCATNKMWYFSRSRNKLWMKGETSHNVQEIVKLRADCDRDTILATVRQKGVACHLGSYSCFGDKIFSLNELYELIRDRTENPRPESYTATLNGNRLKEKIMEEAREIVVAKTKEELIWEIADLLYFITAALVKSDVELSDVINDLRRRRR